jgi:hypothetical protein
MQALEPNGILARRDHNKPPAAYVHQPYPSVRYHRTHTDEKPVTKIVNSDEEHEALVADGHWADTPAAFDEGYVAPASDAPAAEAKKSKSKKSDQQS